MGQWKEERRGRKRKDKSKKGVKDRREDRNFEMKKRNIKQLKRFYSEPS